MRAILTINRGSSSLKFAVYQWSADGGLKRGLSGNFERLGQADASLTARDHSSENSTSEHIDTTTSTDAAGLLIKWLGTRIDLQGLAVIGHRVVHGGMRFSQPERVTSEMLGELNAIRDFDPDHLPAEIALIESLARHFPKVPQVACFDTAFHRHMPRVAQLLAIPRRFDRLGVRRYGFHGLSYAFLMEALAERSGVEVATGRVILAHLGAGASLAAVHGGQSIDTSMGFTPTAGLPMATRSGDLDPGLVSFLNHAEQLTSDGFHDMVNHHSGLLGISETTGDMQELLKCQSTDSRAAEAVELFCYQTKKWIGGFVAVLGGLDALVFSGGIGEHSVEVRRRICNGLEYFGAALDSDANEAGRDLISAQASRVPIYRLATDEELMIARSAAATVEPEPHT
ncbi:MAG TPA: acetate/propionate family kinase [Pirellulales bacterium]|nr:acetate/propionate family kinase [Pirellulales bacterium]